MIKPYLFTKWQKRILLELIGSEQIHMIINNPNSYENKKYKTLEELKIRIKDMEDNYEN